MTAPAQERRKKIPLLVKLQVALRELGYRVNEIEWDHQPALALREWDPKRRDTIPPANDPDHIRILRIEDHRRKTSGTKATTAGSDIHAIAKVKRLSTDEEAFRKRLLEKQPGKPRDRLSSRWPKRAMRGRRKMP